MQLLELLWLNRRRRIRHHISGCLVLWEGNHFTNIRLIRQDHTDPINARCNPAMRRRAELKGLQHMTESFMSNFRLQSDQRKYLFLQLAVVDSDGAAAYFVVVQAPGHTADRVLFRDPYPARGYPRALGR